MSAPTPPPAGSNEPRTPTWAVDLATLGLLPLIATLIVWWKALPGRASVPPWHDVLVSILHQDHLQRAWLSGTPWRTGPVAWPLADSITQSDWVGLSALVGLPLHMLGMSATSEAAVTGVLGLFLSALTTGLLARALLGPGLHIGVASVLGGLHPLAVAHAPYPNLAHSELMVLGALALGAGLHRQNTRLTALGGLLLGGGTWAGFYLGSHAGFVAVVVIGAAAVSRRLIPRTLAASIGGAAVGVASIWPVLSTYSRFSERYHVTTQAGAVRQEVWDPSTGAIFAVGKTPAAVDRAAAALTATDTLAWGRQGLWWVLLGVAVLGVVRMWRSDPTRRWLWGAAATVGVGAAVLALGPELWWRGHPTGVPLPGALVAQLPGLSGLRAPVRWLRVAFPVVALLAAAGLASFGPIARRSLSVIGCVGAFSLLRPMPVIPLAELSVPPLYDTLDDLPAGPIVDLVEGHRTCPHNINHRLAAALDHTRPVMGGLYARRIDTLVQLNRRLLHWPAPDTIELLETAGVVAVIEHATDRPPPPGLSCTEADQHRICALSPRTLPSVDRLAEVQQGPVDAIWWTEQAPARGPIRIQCGDRDTTLYWRTWSLLTQLRHGTTGAVFEVVLPERCAELPVVHGESAGRVFMRAL